MLHENTTHEPAVRLISTEFSRVIVICHNKRMEYMYPLVPQEVFALKLHESDERAVIDGKGSLRVVFVGAVLLPEEEAHLTKFRQFLARQDRLFPSW